YRTGGQWAVDALPGVSVRALLRARHPAVLATTAAAARAGPDQMTVSLHGVVLPCLLGGAEELGLEPDRRVTMLLPALVVHRAPAPLPHPHGPLASLYAAPFLEVPCHGPDRNRPAITGVHRPPSSTYGYGPGHCPRLTVPGPAIRCPSETSPARETSPSRERQFPAGIGCGSTAAGRGSRSAAGRHSSASATSGVCSRAGGVTSHSPRPLMRPT